MASRKSNKTAHVLNLLSNSKEDTGSESLSVSDSGDTPLSAAPSTANTPPAITVLESLGNMEDPLDTVIRDNLEQELSKSLDSVMTSSQQAELPGIPNLTSEEPSTVVSDPEIPTDVPVDSTQTDDVNIEQVKTAKDCSKVPPYLYINVMEYLVKDRVMEYMVKFDLCTCDRCKADIIALALTHLQPKYIVVEHSYSSPLLNFYSNKFNTVLVTELTKACMTVKDNPHH